MQTKLQDQHHEKDYLSKILYVYTGQAKVCRNASWRYLNCNLETILKILVRKNHNGAHITVKP